MSYLTKEFKPYLERSLDPLIDKLAHFKVSPNSITLLGLTFIASGSVLLYLDMRYYGATLLIIGALMDTIDGHLARKTGNQSTFGAFLDSTVDRISDALPFCAFILIYAETGEYLYVLITLIALISSFLVSYTRARAEALGVKEMGGLFERSERWIVLLLGILTHLETIALLIIAIGSSYTSFQRIKTAERLLKSGGATDDTYNGQGRT